MEREIKRELLDELPSNDSGAAGSRRDLRKLNVCMGNADLTSRFLQSAFPKRAPERLVELGAGDGTFLLRVARRLGPRWRGTSALLLDRKQVVENQTRIAFKTLGWKVGVVVADAFEWVQQTGLEPGDAVVANLFLHHFSTAELTGLFNGVAGQARAFVSVEPRRAFWPWLCCQFLWIIGCNHVTRHDAPISVRAGFAGKELSRLWPGNGKWSLHEKPRGLFSHLFTARALA